MSAPLSLVSTLVRLSLRDTRRRLFRTALFGGLAAGLALIALLCLGLALWLWLCTKMTPIHAALVLAGVSAVLALIAGLCAALNARSRSPLQRELGDQAVALKTALKADLAEVPVGLPLAGAGLLGLVLGLKLFGK